MDDGSDFVGYLAVGAAIMDGPIVKTPNNRV